MLKQISGCSDDCERHSPLYAQLHGSCAVGDRHEGEWQDGKQHGAGTAVAADGSSFYGTWQNGKRHGEGVSFRLMTMQSSTHDAALQMFACHVSS